MKRRITALALALLIVFSLVPMTALADDAAVAQINFEGQNNTYASLADAVAAVDVLGVAYPVTITMLTDSEEHAGIAVHNSCVIDLNGKTVTLIDDAESEKSGFTVYENLAAYNGAKVTLKGGTLIAKLAEVDGGTFVIESGSYYMPKDKNYSNYLLKADGIELHLLQNGALCTVVDYAVADAQAEDLASSLLPLVEPKYAEEDTEKTNNLREAELKAFVEQQKETYKNCTTKEDYDIAVVMADLMIQQLIVKYAKEDATARIMAKFDELNTAALKLVAKQTVEDALAKINSYAGFELIGLFAIEKTCLDDLSRLGIAERTAVKAFDFGAAFATDFIQTKNFNDNNADTLLARIISISLSIVSYLFSFFKSAK